MILTLFLIGVFNFIGLVSGYQLFCDYAPESHKALMGTMWNISEGLDIIWVTLYYKYISLDWQHLVWWLVGCHLLFSIGQMIVLIDSPKR